MLSVDIKALFSIRMRCLSSQMFGSREFFFSILQQFIKHVLCFVFCFYAGALAAHGHPISLRVAAPLVLMTLCLWRN